MIFYLTFNDPPSGIYSSQVIDVVKYLKQFLKLKVKLVAFISLRGFSRNRKLIKTELADAIIIPMFPGVHHWRKNLYALKLLALVKHPELIIGRSVLATQLALSIRTKNRKVVYDGRGAIAAEWTEYGVIRHGEMLEQVKEWERSCVINSDHRISVSHQLLKYWRETYQYKGEAHVVIPCTLNKLFEEAILNSDEIAKTRLELGFHNEDIVFVYSGSLAGWQSFALLSEFISPLMDKYSKYKILFLADQDENIKEMASKYPGRVGYKKVPPTEVPLYLMASDYGLLIRERSLTNKVASPVKFAEYLACGLKVIISNDLGDYSDFVIKNNCGYNYNSALELKAITFPEKQEMRKLALNKFRKIDFINEYKKCLGV